MQDQDNYKRAAALQPPFHILLSVLVAVLVWFYG